MTTRRKFLKLGIAGSSSLMVGRSAGSFSLSGQIEPRSGPLILSTWEHGMPANEKALEILRNGGSVLDAVERGVAVVESDFSNRSVGLGGLPDRDGFVTLDACIQDHDGRAGSVAFVQQFENPIKIARAVMERTPHVMLVGSGGERWAIENGFTRKQVEIPEVRQRWQQWLNKSGYTPQQESEKIAPTKTKEGSIQDHDTIGLIAMDTNGRLAGACTTSGLAWKIHGRVGDSPIIGAGLFVDGDAGAACATGVGELVIRTAGSHTIVELMRQGLEPTEACREAIRRILKKHTDLQDKQVGFLAIRADGAFGAWSIEKGFEYALYNEERNQLIAAEHEN